MVIWVFFVCFFCSVEYNSSLAASGALGGNEAGAEACDLAPVPAAEAESDASAILLCKTTVRLFWSIFCVFFVFFCNFLLFFEPIRGSLRSPLFTKHGQSFITRPHHRETTV